MSQRAAALATLMLCHLCMHVAAQNEVDVALRSYFLGHCVAARSNQYKQCMVDSSYMTGVRYASYLKTFKTHRKIKSI